MYIKMIIAKIRKIKLTYNVCKTRISKLGFCSKMSIRAGKPIHTSWQGDLGRAGWEIQNRVTKLFVKTFSL